MKTEKCRENIFSTGYLGPLEEDNACFLCGLCKENPTLYHLLRKRDIIILLSVFAAMAWHGLNLNVQIFY